ncbi:MAG: VOC family protein [Candidatus Gracilibacteria bacterium]|nr:VOC family protein [Candidatus Gracilibacteria bacterium]
MKKMNPVVHFEMPAEDRKRMSSFYTNVFGWETTQLGPEMGDYVVVMTTESDEKGPKKRGAINGGFYQKTDDPLSGCPGFVIHVDDVNEYVKKVEEAGGKIIGNPMDINGVGLYVSFVDTEGNRVGMLEPTGM